MAISISNELARAMLNAVDPIIDGSGVAELRVYGGTRAANPETATGETLLVAFTLATPSFGNATDQDPDPKARITAGSISTENGVATDTATWFRIVKNGAAAGAAGVIDGDVDDAPGADLQINTTTIVLGNPVSVTSLFFELYE